jgi:hypothetical protein
MLLLGKMSKGQQRRICMGEGTSGNNFWVASWRAGLHHQFGGGRRRRQQQNPFRRGREEVGYRGRGKEEFW